MTEGTDVEIARLQERLAAAEKALELQAGEISRRLDELNHARAVEREKERDYVTVEKFDGFVARFEENKEVTAKALTLAEGNKQGMGMFAGWIVGGVGFLLALGSLVLVIGDVLTP
jgi:GTP-dependent phosphoenolpyruvate carboxykinase